MQPIAFIRRGRPPTANRNLGPTGERAKQELRALYAAAGGSWSDEHRYGIVCYFVRGCRPATDADAGNVSKRIWDALEGVAYEDDHVVRLQLAGVVDIGAVPAGQVAYEDIDLTGIPNDALTRLLEFVAGEERHVLYVEIGALRSSMFAFNLAGR